MKISSSRFELNIDAYRRSASARVSLVDHTSFALMRALGISRAFAFDDDFAREGFALVA
jgi:predicted nucleic acid-binding protein